MHDSFYRFGYQGLDTTKSLENGYRMEKNFTVTTKNSIVEQEIKSLFVHVGKLTPLSITMFEILFCQLVDIISMKRICLNTKKTLSNTMSN